MFQLADAALTLKDLSDFDKGYDSIKLEDNSVINCLGVDPYQLQQALSPIFKFSSSNSVSNEQSVSTNVNTLPIGISPFPGRTSQQISISLGELRANLWAEEYRVALPALKIEHSASTLKRLLPVLEPNPTPIPIQSLLQTNDSVIQCS